MTTIWIVQEENNENFGENYAGAFRTRLRAVAKVREIAEEYITHMLYDDEAAVANVREQLTTLERSTEGGAIGAPGGQFTIGLYMQEME